MKQTLLLDASVLLASEDHDDQNHEHARSLLRGAASLVTLDLARYETSNVAIRAWSSAEAARRLSKRIDAIGDDGGVIRVDSALIAEAEVIAHKYQISVYDAAYAAAAERSSAQLVSCDMRDLVSRGLAILPGAVRET